MTTPFVPLGPCCFLRSTGRHTQTCAETTRKVRAELGAPASGQWWVGNPELLKDPEEPCQQP